ncbi:hypothetical protein GCM10010344_02070 [Streptomyces bluensis]|nr:hypothetical protein GCM10010344_02070 [Streptomyces bluensis]
MDRVRRLRARADVSRRPSAPALAEPSGAALAAAAAVALPLRERCEGRWLADGDLLTRIRCAEAAVRTPAAAGTVDLVRALPSSGTAMMRAEAVHGRGQP